MLERKFNDDMKRWDDNIRALLEDNDVDKVSIVLNADVL